MGAVSLCKELRKVIQQRFIECFCVRPWRYSSEQTKAPGAQVLTPYYRDKPTSRDRYLGPYRRDKGSELTRAVLSRSTS